MEEAIEIKDRKGNIKGKLKDNVYYTRKEFNYWIEKKEEISLQEEIIKELEEKGCIHVRIEYEKNGNLKVIHCPLKFFKNYGKRAYNTLDDIEISIKIRKIKEYMENQTKEIINNGM